MTDIVTLDYDEPIGPQPEPATSGLRPAVQRMLADLDARYKGADPGTVKEAMTAMGWDSQGQAGQALKAYKEKHGIPTKPAPVKKTAARTKPTKAARTAPVRPKPTPPVPPVVRADPLPVVQAPVPTPPAVVHADPVPQPPTVVRRAVVWPVIVLAQPAFIAVWSGWVGLGGMTGFGVVRPLPGIWDSLSLNTAITLPIGVETYGAYALYIWLSGLGPRRARRFAMWSSLASLFVGVLGQIAYHLLVAAGWTVAPWWITTLVSSLPVIVLGMGAALAHLVRAPEEDR